MEFVAGVGEVIGDELVGDAVEERGDVAFVGGGILDEGGEETCVVGEVLEGVWVLLVGGDVTCCVVVVVLR